MTAREAEVGLNDWILSCPATRTVYTIERTRGKWRVGLAVNNSTDSPGGCERLTPGESSEYSEAIQNAIEIARLAGYP